MSHFAYDARRVGAVRHSLACSMRMAEREMQHRRGGTPKPCDNARGRQLHKGASATPVSSGCLCLEAATYRTGQERENIERACTAARGLDTWPDKQTVVASHSSALAAANTCPAHKARSEVNNDPCSRAPSEIFGAQRPRSQRPHRRAR